MTTDWTQRIRLRHLTILIELAQSGNISQTAAALNMTQPGISRWLKELEDDIGLSLFERHARGLRPTSHGAVLVEHAHRILANLDVTKDDLDARHHEGGGIVRIGSTGAATAETAPMAILDLLKHQPKTKVSLLEGTMDRLISKLNLDQLDVVIGRSAPEILNHEICFETLYLEPLLFIAKKNHPLTEKLTLSWEDILKYRWIIWPKNTPIRQDLEQALIAEQHVLPTDYIESNSTLMNITLLNNSDYISVASARTAQRLCQLGAVDILNLSLSGQGSVSIFWKKDHNRPAITKTLQAFRNVSAGQR